MFSKWNDGIEKKLGQIGKLYIGGNKPTAGDFKLFSVYADSVLNEHSPRAELKRALLAKMDSTPEVLAWVERMKGELKNYLA